MHKIPIGHILRGYIHPQTNQLLAVVELKRLFQGSLSLEDFHMEALRLVAQTGYTGAAKDKVLRDNIISGLASDKIWAKIVKEGHEVTLNWGYGNSQTWSLYATTPGQDARDC